MGQRVQAWERWWVISCGVCGAGDRVTNHKPYVGEKAGRIAAITGVSVTACESCRETWLTAEVAHALDAMLTEMLEQDTLGVRALTGGADAA